MMSDAITSEIVTVALIADYDSRTVVMRARRAGGLGLSFYWFNMQQPTDKRRRTTTTITTHNAHTTSNQNLSKQQPLCVGDENTTYNPP